MPVPGIRPPDTLPVIRDVKTTDYRRRATRITVEVCRPKLLNVSRFASLRRDVGQPGRFNRIASPAGWI